MPIGGDLCLVQKIKDYFDNIVCCENPNPSVETQLQHPCEKSLKHVKDLEEDLAELVNRVQRHTVCRKNSCLKKSKDGTLKCR